MHINRKHITKYFATKEYIEYNTYFFKYSEQQFIL